MSYSRPSPFCSFRPPLTWLFILTVAVCMYPACARVTIHRNVPYCTVTVVKSTVLYTIIFLLLDTGPLLSFSVNGIKTYVYVSIILVNMFLHRYPPGSSDKPWSTPSWKANLFLHPYRYSYSTSLHCTGTKEEVYLRYYVRFLAIVVVCQNYLTPVPSLMAP